MPLLEYTDLEISEFLNDVSILNTSNYLVISALNVLNKDIYKKAILALMSDLISFDDIRSLVTINNNLIEKLIYTKMDDTDVDALAWRYRTDYLINHTKYDTYKKESIGNKYVYATRLNYDIYSEIYIPKYDPSGSDPNKYISFDEVRAAYEAAAKMSSITKLIERFNYVRNYTSIHFPVSVPINGTDCVKEAVLSCLTNPWFIFSQLGPSGDIWNVCELLINNIFENVPPHLFIDINKNIVSYAMANRYVDDATRSGYPGMVYLRETTLWDDGFKYEDNNFMKFLSTLYISKYYLPRMYNDLYPQDKEKYIVLLNYLRIARTTIIEIRNNIISMIEDPVKVRKTLLAPLGLLFLVSGVSFSTKEF